MGVASSLNGTSGPVVTLTFPTTDSSYVGEFKSFSSIAPVSVVVSSLLAGAQFTMNLDNPLFGSQASAAYVDVQKFTDVGITLKAQDGFSTPLQLSVASATVSGIDLTFGPRSV